MTDVKLNSIRPVARETLRERVYEEVRAALMEGKFKPGEPLRLQAVADAVGTSLMPVREALRRLVAERALVTTHSRAMLVPFPTEAEFVDIMETRLQLEPFAARLASRNFPAKQLSELENLHQRMLSSEKPSDYLRYNQRFHFGVYKAADRPILLSHIESLWLHIGPLLNHLLGQMTLRAAQDRVELTADRHRQLLDALKAGDDRASARAVAEDIKGAGKVILDLIRSDAVERGSVQPSSASRTQPASAGREIAL